MKTETLLAGNLQLATMLRLRAACTGAKRSFDILVSRFISTSFSMCWTRAGGLECRL